MRKLSNYHCMYLCTYPFSRAWFQDSNTEEAYTGYPAWIAYILKSYFDFDLGVRNKINKSQKIFKKCPQKSILDTLYQEYKMSPIIHIGHPVLCMYKVERGRWKLPPIGPKLANSPITSEAFNQP